MKILATDVIHRELLEESVRAAVAAGAQCLLGTGAAILKSGLGEGGKAARGKKVQVPYFGSIGEFEDVVTDGDALTPAPAVNSEEEALVQHAGKAIELTMFAQQGVDDPYAEYGRQIREGAIRRFDKALIDAALAADAGMTNDTGATLSYDSFVDTLMKFGDEQNDVAAFIMNSTILGKAMKIKETTGAPIFTSAKEGELPRVLGKPVIVSDKLTPTGNKHPTLLVKKGALILWYNENVSVETDRDILSDSDIVACHIYFAAHRYKRLNGLTKSGVSKLLTTEA